MMAPDEKRLMHGEIIIDGHKCFLSDEFGPDEGGTVKTPQRWAGPACASRSRWQMPMLWSNARWRRARACLCLCRIFSGEHAMEDSRSVRSRVGHQPAVERTDR